MITHLAGGFAFGEKQFCCPSLAFGLLLGLKFHRNTLTHPFHAAEELERCGEAGTPGFRELVQKASPNLCPYRSLY